MQLRPETVDTRRLYENNILCVDRGQACVVAWLEVDGVLFRTIIPCDFLTAKGQSALFKLETLC